MTEATRDAIKLSKAMAEGFCYNDLKAMLKASCNAVSDYAFDVLTLACYESFKYIHVDDEETDI